MKQRVSLFSLRVIALFLLLAGGWTGVFADSDIVYSLSTDADIQGKAVGSSFESTTWLIRSGDPTLSIVDVRGAKGIRIVGRDVDWDCVDLRNLASLPDGFTYTVTVTGRAEANEKMRLSQAKGPYKTHLIKPAGADGVFSIEKTFTRGATGRKRRRIQTEARRIPLQSRTSSSREVRRDACRVRRLRRSSALSRRPFHHFLRRRQERLGGQVQRPESGQRRRRVGIRLRKRGQVFVEGKASSVVEGLYRREQRHTA